MPEKRTRGSTSLRLTRRGLRIRWLAVEDKLPRTRGQTQRLLQRLGVVRAEVEFSAGRESRLHPLGGLLVHEVAVRGPELRHRRRPSWIRLTRQEFPELYEALVEPVRSWCLQRGLLDDERRLLWGQLIWSVPEGRLDLRGCSWTREPFSERLEVWGSSV